jgi:TolB-like protein/DNA-binding SARP family transcriptional activator/Tfp pilus assembly protein PilF
MRLTTLGRLDLRDDAGNELHAALAHPERMALLVYLATARPYGTHRRDTLLPLFWPTLDEAHAHDVLEQTLRFLGDSLGADIFVRRGEDEVGVDAERLWCDARAFRETLESGECGDALALYTGTFLDGVVFDDASGFQQWVERERSSLRELAAGGARRLAEAHRSAREFGQAVECGRRGLNLVPDDERSLRELLLAYEGCGDRAAALQVHHQFARRLRDEGGGELSSETLAVVDRLKVGRRGDSESDDRERFERDSAHAPFAGRAGRPSPNARRRTGTLAVTAFAVVAIASVVGMLRLRRPAGAALRPASIAVVSSAPAAADSSAAYIAEGMAEDIATILSRNPDITVKFSQAALSAGDRRVPLRELAGALDVANVLSLGVQRVGPVFRIAANLTRPGDGTVLWSEQYDRESPGLFRVQSEIVDAIAETLGVRLVTSRGNAFGTTDPEAYKLYLQGRYHLDRQGRDNLRLALELFRRAVERDGQFARAHAGQSEATTLLTLYDPRDAATDTLLRAALWTAARAVALDGTLGDGHAALGEALAYLGRRREAEHAYRKAVALDPKNATAHRWFAELLFAEGRVDEATAQMVLSTQSDPFSGINFAIAANHFRIAGRVDEALRYGRRGVELNPNVPATWELYGHALYAAGMRDSAERVFSVHAPSHPLYAYIRAQNGNAAVRDSVQRVARAFREEPAPESTAPPNAVISLAAGDLTAALDALERAAARSPAFPLHDPLVDPIYDPLRDSTRFLAIVRRAGLDERLNVRPARLPR